MQQTGAPGLSPADLAEMMPWQSRVPPAWELCLAARGYVGACPPQPELLPPPGQAAGRVPPCPSPRPSHHVSGRLGLSLPCTLCATLGAAASLPVAVMSSTHPQIQPSSALSLCCGCLGGEMLPLPLAPCSLQLETILLGLTNDSSVT